MRLSRNMLNIGEKMLLKLNSHFLRKKWPSMCIDTLKYPFYEKMIGSSSLFFSDLVTIRERFKMCIKLGKIIDSPPKAVNAENLISKEVEEEYIDGIVMSIMMKPEIPS